MGELIVHDFTNKPKLTDEAVTLIEEEIDSLKIMAHDNCDDEDYQLAVALELLLEWYKNAR